MDKGVKVAKQRQRERFEQFWRQTHQAAKLARQQAPRLEQNVVALRAPRQRPGQRLDM